MLKNVLILEKFDKYVLLYHNTIKMDFIAQFKAALLEECKVQLIAELKPALLAEIRAELSKTEKKTPLVEKTEEKVIFVAKSAKDWSKVEENDIACEIFDEWFVEYGDQYNHIRHAFNSLIKYQGKIEFVIKGHDKILRTDKDVWTVDML